MNLSRLSRLSTMKWFRGLSPFILLDVLFLLLVSEGIYCQEAITTSTSVNHTDNHGGIARQRSEVITDVLYVAPGKTANLNCGPLPLSYAVTWHKNKNDNSGMVEITQDICQILRDNVEESEQDFTKCGFIRTLIKKDTYMTATLRIKNIGKDDYQSYRCMSGNTVIREFQIRGDLKVTRKEHGDTSRSVILTEGEILKLYCTYTGLEPENDISKVGFLNVSWFKGEEVDNNIKYDDITQELEEGLGLFSNFTKDEKDPNTYEGVSTHKHRGAYKCSVNLSENLSTVIHHKGYPLEFKFNVRVRDPQQWMLPGGILLVEILAMAIFTAIIWRREESKDENEIGDGDADSDDEEEKNTKL